LISENKQIPNCHSGLGSESIAHKDYDSEAAMTKKTQLINK